MGKIYNPGSTEGSDVAGAIPFVNYAIVFIAIFSIFCLRAVDALSFPALPLEDGTYFFGYFYSSGFFHSLTFPMTGVDIQGGYVILIANLLAYVFARLPTEVRPHAFVIASLLFSAAAMSVFYAPVFRKVVKSDLQRALVCITVSLFPLGNYAKISVLSYSQWSLLIILCQLVCADLLHDIKETRYLAIYTVFLVLLICSNPGSVFLAPLIAFEAYRHRQGGLRTQIPSGVLLLTMLIYAIVSSSRAHWFQYSAVQDTIRAIVERVIFEAMAGCVPRYLLQKHNIWFIYLISLVALLLISYAFMTFKELKNRELRLYVLRSCYLILTITFLTTIVINISVDTMWDRRYTYVQSVLFLFIATIVFWTWFFYLKSNARILLSAVFILVLVRVNMVNQQLYRTSREEGAGIRAFVQEIASAEKKGESRPIHFERGRWSIDVISRPKH